MVVRHNGEPDLIESGDDDLSLAVLRSVVTDMYAAAIDEPPYRGRVTLRLRSAWDRGPAGAGEGTVRL